MSHSIHFVDDGRYLGRSSSSSTASTLSTFCGESACTHDNRQTHAPNKRTKGRHRWRVMGLAGFVRTALGAADTNLHGRPPGLNPKPWELEDLRNHRYSEYSDQGGAGGRKAPAAASGLARGLAQSVRPAAPRGTAPRRPSLPRHCRLRPYLVGPPPRHGTAWQARAMAATGNMTVSHSRAARTNKHAYGAGQPEHVAYSGYSRALMSANAHQLLPTEPQRAAWRLEGHWQRRRWRWERVRPASRADH